MSSSKAFVSFFLFIRLYELDLLLPPTIEPATFTISPSKVTILFLLFLLIIVACFIFSTNIVLPSSESIIGLISLLKDRTSGPKDRKSFSFNEPKSLGYDL